MYGSPAKIPHQKKSILCSCALFNHITQHKSIGSWQLPPPPLAFSVKIAKCLVTIYLSRQNDWSDCEWLWTSHLDIINSGPLPSLPHLGSSRVWGLTKDPHQGSLRTHTRAHQEPTPGLHHHLGSSRDHTRTYQGNITHGVHDNSLILARVLSNPAKSWFHDMIAIEEGLLRARLQPNLALRQKKTTKSNLSSEFNFEVIFCTLAYGASTSSAVIWRWNFPLLVNLPMHVPRLMRFFLAMFVHFLIIISLQWYKTKW